MLPLVGSGSEPRNGDNEDDSVHQPSSELPDLSVAPKFNPETLKMLDPGLLVAIFASDM